MSKPIVGDMGMWMRTRESREAALTRRGSGRVVVQEISMYPLMMAWNFDPALASSTFQPTGGRATLQRLTTTESGDPDHIRIHITSGGDAGTSLIFGLFDLDGALLGHATASGTNATTPGSKDLPFDTEFDMGAGNELWVVLQGFGAGNLPTLAAAPGAPPLNAGLTSASPYRFASRDVATPVNSVVATDFSIAMASARPFIGLESAS